MDNTPAEDGSKRLPTAEADDAPTLTAEIVDSPDGLTECTIFPLDGSNAELVTQWITAGEGSFVTLSDRR